MNENLTPQIVAALLQDGTCKLTKAQMTTAVAAAVANLPKAYVFGGVVQPGLAPGSIPAPTLFVAVAVGAYGSFSNASVDVGEIVFFTSDDGGAWTRIEVYSATQAAVDAAIAAALETAIPAAVADAVAAAESAIGPVPKPIVLTDLPTAEMTTQDELDAIGITADEIAAAAQGLRTGVVVGTTFYFITEALVAGEDYIFAFESHDYDQSAFGNADGYTITFEGGVLEVRHGLNV